MTYLIKRIVMVIIMKKDNSLNIIAIITVPICWAIGLIIGLIFYFALKDSMHKVWTVSFVLGLITALLNLGLMVSWGHGFVREVNRADGAPVRRSILSYATRLLIAGLIFAYIVYEEATAETPRFNVIPALIGYVIVKMVFIIVSLVINLKKDKQQGKVSA
jgi:hypothetical protein